MYPLERFYEDDVNESATVDSFTPNRAAASFFPGWSLILMVTTWLGSVAFGKAKVAKGKAKVRQARAEILPRSPTSLICPNCYEVLERL